MKIRELIAILEKQDPDREVIVSRDSEGNGYSPICERGGDCMAYHPEEREVYMELKDLTPEARAQGYTEEDAREVDTDEGFVRAFVIFP